MYWKMKTSKKVEIFIVFIIILSAVFYISCKDNRSEEQKVLDFIYNFDRRVFIKYRSGVQEYNAAKEAVNYNSTNWDEYAEVLEHFQNAITFFKRASINGSVIEALEEDSQRALDKLVNASDIYWEATNIYIRLIKSIYEDSDYDYDEALQQTYALEYKAEKKILEVHLNIKDFEKKYPETFTEEWEKQLNELIREQEEKILKIRQLYGTKD